MIYSQFIVFELFELMWKLNRYFPISIRIVRINILVLKPRKNNLNLTE